VNAPHANTAQVLRRLGDTGLEVMSAALSDPFKDEGWTDAFREMLAQRTNTPNFGRLVDDIAEMRGEVSAAAERWYEKASGL
jgi:glutamate-ammonia-ligase adenylyltransferase